MQGGWDLMLSMLTSPKSPTLPLRLGVSICSSVLLAIRTVNNIANKLQNQLKAGFALNWFVGKK